MSENTNDSGDVAEKRVRKSRATTDAASAAAQAAANAPPPAPAPAPPPPPVESAPPAPAAPQSHAGEQGGQQEGHGQNDQGQNDQGRFNRRDRFRNRRDRQRDRYRDDGMPQDNGGEQQPFQARSMPGVPEGFPQYSLSDLKRMPAPKLLEIANS